MKTLQEHARHFGLHKPKNVLNYKGRVKDPPLQEIKLMGFVPGGVEGISY